MRHEMSRFATRGSIGMARLNGARDIPARRDPERNRRLPVLPARPNRKAWPRSGTSRTPFMASPGVLPLLFVIIAALGGAAGIVAEPADVSEVASTAQPIPRTDANSRRAHEQLVEKAKKDGIDVYFLGDSITRRW